MSLRNSLILYIGARLQQIRSGRTLSLNVIPDLFVIPGLTGNLSKVVLLDVLEVPVCIDFELAYCKFVSHDDAVLMSLEGRKRARL